MKVSQEITNMKENIHKPTQREKRPLYQKFLLLGSLLIAVFGTLTGLMTYINIGFIDTFFINWFTSFIIAILVMIPTGLLFIHVIERLIELLVPHTNPFKKQLITGVSMALVMETVMSASTATNTVGYANATVFLTAWGQSFITALPLGLCIGVIMSTVLKPKLKSFITS